MKADETMSEKLLVSPDEAATMLGLRREYLLRLARRGDIKSIKLGHGRRRVVRFSVAHLRELAGAN
jgi:excisionase family DNA binding protein